MSGRYLLHHFGILVEHAGKIHHLAEIFYFAVFQQGAHLGRIEGGAGRFECSGRYATGRPEIEYKGDGPPVGDHKFHAGQPADIGDLVRIAYRGDGAMDYGEACEFRGYEEGTFDMDMRIDETGEDVGEGSRGPAALPEIAGPVCGSSSSGRMATIRPDSIRISAATIFSFAISTSLPVNLSMILFFKIYFDPGKLKK